MERKTNFSLHSRGRTLKGFSTLELMVALALASLITAALYTFMSKQHSVYTLQDQTAEMQQNLRGALEKITRDLEMAGFGKPWWTGINGSSGLDFSVKVTGGNTLEIVGCLDPPAATLASTAAANSTTMTVQGQEGLNFKSGSSVSTYKKDISIDGKEPVRITNVSGGTNNTLTIDRNPGGSGNQGLLYAYPATTTKIYIVKYVSYSVNTAVDPPVLQINEHQGAGDQPLADNISALQTSKAGDVVTVTLTGRTRNRDRSTGNYLTGQITGKVQVRNP